jgi:hypothetical protein
MSLDEALTSRLEGLIMNAASGVMEDFHHEPLDHDLDQIRLVRIQHRASPDDTVSCTISTFERKTCPSYCALSYTWGPPEPVHTIQLNGRRFVVRDMLHYFLDNVVHDSRLEVDYIWIDQLCIDQKSNSEKNHQVQRMSKIYSQASHVVAWTGFEDTKEDDVMRARDRVRHPFALRDVTSFLQMCRQKYWTRLWIVQELFLARSVKFAYKARVWSIGDVWRFINLNRAEVGELREILDLGYFLLSDMQAVYRFQEVNGEPALDLGYALRTYGCLQCEDPRDQVYGVQAIVERGERLVADYSKTTNDIFIDVLGTFCLTNRIYGQRSRNFPVTLAGLGTRMGLTGCEQVFQTEHARQLFRDIFGDATPQEVFDAWVREDEEFFEDSEVETLSRGSSGAEDGTEAAMTRRRSI